VYLELGGGVEGDPVAHGGKLGDVVADLSLGDDAAGVAVGTEVPVAGGGVASTKPSATQMDWYFLPAQAHLYATVTGDATFSIPRWMRWEQ
jgi:hypothetical protein